MTFSLKNYLLLSAVGATALCSCSNEDFDGFGSDAEARMVEMTVTLAKGDVDDDMSGSRTTLVENGGDLTCLWEANDRVLIATADGKAAGVLTLSDGVGQATATFTGQVDANAISSATPNTYVYVHYFGTEVNPETVTTTYIHDFSTQPGTLESLSDYDYFRNTVNITLSGDVLTTNYTAKLSRVTAFGRFHLNFSDGAILTPDAQVTVTGSFLHTVGNFGLKDQCTFDPPTTNTITTAIDPANGDIWLTILPASAPKTTSLTFTVTVGETTYTGTLAERQWKANEYVRATLDDGTFAGIPVEMTPSSTGGDDNGETNEYGEPLNNPLAKWAKGNLYRVDGLTNGILEDETDNGALYQWGRNYGYMDTKGFWETYTALDGSTWDPGEDFTNNIDALGTFEYDGHSRTFDFYVTNPQNVFVGTATGFNSNGGYIDVPRKYETLAELQANPDKYYMDFGTKTGDYWLSSFGDGGNTWEARATACGYEQANPCPEGWRIPTMKEFKEIAPQVNKESTNTLTNLLMNSAELRETEGGVRYVIRWNNRSTYIEIQSLVVDNSFTESNISTIIWDNNPSVVTRIFPFTGNINDLIGYDRYLGVYYARPYHRGVVDAGVFSDYSYNMWTIIGPGGNCGDGLGAYWIADAKQAFKFIDKGINPSYEKTSCLLIEAGDPEMGYAIRPVRDYSK